MRSILLWLPAVGLLACSTQKTGPSLEGRDAWARPADSAGTTAVYLRIVNHDSTTALLTSESSSVAESVSLHETMAMSGMIHMMPLDSAQAIAPGDSLTLKQGAKHLMVSGLKRKLVIGDSLPVDLTFKDGRVVHVTATVRAP